MGFPSGSVVKEPACNAGDTGDAGLILGSGRSLAGGHGNRLQYSCLDNPMNRGDKWAIVHGATVHVQSMGYSCVRVRHD